jgi:hypothetical protein
MVDQGLDIPAKKTAGEIPVNRHPVLDFALKAPKGLHQYKFDPRKIQTLNRTTKLEVTQYDAQTKTATFIYEPMGRSIDRVRLALFSNNNDLTPSALIEMKGTAIDHAKPFTRYTSVLKNVPPETPYQFLVNYAGGKEAYVADPFGGGMVPGRWGENKTLINPKSILMDYEFISGFPTTFRMDKPINPNKLKFLEIHVAYTKNIPDSELPPEFRGTQNTVFCLACPQVMQRAKDLGKNALQIMPLQSSLTEWANFIQGKTNEWNYNSSSHYAPNPNLYLDKSAHGMYRETQLTIQRIYEEYGVYTFLDGVYGHNSESDVSGAPHSLALSGDFFHLNERGEFVDTSGCGNGFNYDSPLAMDLLRQVPFHVFDLQGFHGIRGDQLTALGRRSESLIFDGSSPAIQFLGKEALDRGKVIVAEPCDCASGFQIHHGEFDHTIAEQDVAGRDKIQAWMSGNCERGFEHSNLIGTDKEGHDSIIRSALSLYGREFLHDKHVGKYDFRKPLDTVMVDCHDGLPCWDRTKHVYDALINAGGLKKAFPEISNPVEREHRIRLQLARGMKAMAVFRPGPHLARYNSDTLATQNMEHDAYTNGEYLQMERISPDHPLRAIKEEALRCDIKDARLREAITAFDDRADHPKHKIELYDVEGRQTTENNLTHEHARRSGATIRELTSLGRYAGICFTHSNKSLAETIKAGFGDKRPAFLALSGFENEFYLPEIPKGYVWLRKVDTQLPIESSYKEVPCTANPHNRENSKQAHYSMNMPGKVIFELYRAAELPARVLV